MLKRDRSHFLGGCAKDLGDLPRAHEAGAKLPWTSTAFSAFIYIPKTHQTKTLKLQTTPNPKLIKFRTGRVSLDWRSRKGNLCILQYCHIHHRPEHRPWPQEMAEIKIYNHKIIVTLQWCLPQNKPNPSAQSLCSYLIYQDKMCGSFFRLLGPAVLLEEQHSLWKYYRTLEKKVFSCYTCPLCSGFDPAWGTEA